VRARSRSGTRRAVLGMGIWVGEGLIFLRVKACGSLDEILSHLDSK
jgi:hypothetical protein